MIDSRIAGALWAALLVAPAARARTITVDGTGEGDYRSVQAALDAARAGDEIVVAPGEYVLDATLDFNRRSDASRPWTPPPRDLVVRSAEGPESTVLRFSDAEPPYRRPAVIVFRSGESRLSLLEGFTVRGGGAGGVVMRGSSPTIRHCIVESNTGTRGGGVECSAGSSPWIEECVVRDNRASMGGGVACADGSSPVLVACRIVGNEARADDGGGLFGRQGCSPLVAACIIAGNSSDDGGAAASFTLDSPAKFLHTTIAGNWHDSDHTGGIAAALDSPPTLEGCVVWGNNGFQIFTDESSTARVAHSVVEGEAVWPGEGNRNGDPRFVDPGEFDFFRFARDGLPRFLVRAPDVRLGPGSAALDAVPVADALPFDIDGRRRPCGDAADAGAHEADDCGAQVRFRRADADGDSRQNITDAIFVLLYLFAGGDAPGCAAAGDVDDNGAIELTDPIALLGHLFLGAPPPPAPFPTCGFDFTAGALDCASPPSCGAGRSP